jgi:crossover junction endodeoxyribonuclease RuvC
VDALPGRRVRLVEVGVARSAAHDDPAARLRAIGDVIEEWLDRHTPDAVAVERVFAQHNVRTVMGTAQVSGVVMVAAARRGIPVALHTPSEVKAAVTGSGRADKAQVTSMVTRILDLDARPTPADAADALALAICHLWRPAAALPGPGAGAGPGRRTGGTPAQQAWAEAEAAARRSGA